MIEFVKQLVVYLFAIGLIAVMFTGTAIVLYQLYQFVIGLFEKE